MVVLYKRMCSRFAGPKMSGRNVTYVLTGLPQGGVPLECIATFLCTVQTFDPLHLSQLFVVISCPKNL